MSGAAPGAAGGAAAGAGAGAGAGGGGAAALGGLGGSLEHKDSSLLCPVCFELIDEAYVTRCGHSFCYACIARCVELHRRCPKCGAALPQRDHIFPNFLLNELVAKRRVRLSRGASSPPAGGGAGAGAAGGGAGAGDAERLRELVAAGSRHLPLADVQSMLAVLTRRARALQADTHHHHHTLLYQFLSRLHAHRTLQLEQLRREAALVARDMRHVAHVLRDLPPPPPPPPPPPVAADGDDTASSVSGGGGGGGEGAEEEESFAGGAGGAAGGGDALAARWRRLTAHFDDFVQCYFAHRADELYFPGSSAPSPSPAPALAPAPAGPSPAGGDLPPPPGPNDGDHVPLGPHDARPHSAAARAGRGGRGRGRGRGGGRAGGRRARREPDGGARRGRGRARRGAQRARLGRRRAPRPHAARTRRGRCGRAGVVPRGPGLVHAVPRAAPARHALLLQRRYQLLDHRLHHRVRQGRRVLRDRGRHQAHQGVRAGGGAARRGGRALPGRGDAVLAQDLLRLLERVPQAGAGERGLRGHGVGVGRAHGAAHARAARARQARLVRALQPRRRAPARLRLRRRARQAVGAQRGAIGGHAGGEVQRVLRAVQPALVGAPRVRLGGPLRPLLRPALAARAARRAARPPQGRLLRQVPGRADAGLRVDGLAAEAVEGGLPAVRALVHRPREREELRGARDGRQVRGVRQREQRAVRVLLGALAAAARVQVRGGARVPGARAARRGAERVRVGGVLAPRAPARRAAAARRQQPGHHQGAGARLSAAPLPRRPATCSALPPVSEY